VVDQKSSASKKVAPLKLKDPDLDAIWHHSKAPTLMCSFLGCLSKSEPPVQSYLRCITDRPATHEKQEKDQKRTSRGHSLVVVAPLHPLFWDGRNRWDDELKNTSVGEQPPVMLAWNPRALPGVQSVSSGNTRPRLDTGQGHRCRCWVWKWR
jgi:hypothetical protein